MGNSESSSQLPPPPPRSNDGNNTSSARVVEEEESNTSSASAILKVGAAVAGTALVALGAAAYTLASSSSSQSDDRDGGKREAHMEALEARGFNSDVSLNNYVHHRSPNPRNLKHLGDSDQYSELRKIKIMSYNVWSEGVEVEERMNAIGELIEEHNPDIIFFQEVTSNIYELFHDSNWWKNYPSSVPPQKLKTRKHFCMLLSKLPVKWYTCEPFKNSKTRKVLCIAEVDAGTNKKLIVATSHLKRPKPRKTNSLERVAQAKEALEILQSSAANVIYGGDMNWDEKTDGDFPLPEGWYDAWSNRNPREDGWTYDTKRNAMLKGNRPLTKRLDRFVCKLKDYKVVSVRMIGTDAIPGIHNYHEDRDLPVLPSDHFGLILAIGPM